MTAPSTAARRAAWSARLDAAMTSAATRVTALVPGLGADEATAALEAAVPITVRSPARFLEELTGHLTAHPDALTSGSSRCPLVLLRLVHALHDAGHPVVRPGCAHCGTVRDDLRWLRPEGRICGTCDTRSRRGTCSRCGAAETGIAARRPEGVICHPCYRKDPAVVEDCRSCGRTRNPVVRLSDGGALCSACWQRPDHRCASCGAVGPAALLTDQGAFCHRCYERHHRPRRPCGRCGRLARIARNAVGDQPDLCENCYRGPRMPCSRCGRIRPCQRVGSGKPICATCYSREERPRRQCARCHRSRPVLAYWPIGAVCHSCYTAILRAPAQCARCRTLQPLIGRGPDGAGICGPCAGYETDYACRQCGRPGNPYGRGRCAHCVLADRVRALLTGPGATMHPQLAPVAEALARSATPFKTIHWIKQSPNAALLARLAAEQRPLTHDLLDELPHGRNVHYIRAIMVHTGVLPERNEDLERLPAWLEHELSGKPVRHALLVRPYLHWHLLRRARRRAAVRRFPASAASHLRRRLLVALELLAWLDEQGLTLAELRQDQVDRWLDAGGSQKRTLVRYFLAWTAARGLTRKLTVPRPPFQQPADLLGDEERWNLLHRCLTDSTLPVDVRAAGALVLLFALPVERIRHLTTDQVIQQEQDTYILAGRHPMLTPPRLARLLDRLAAEPGEHLTIPHDLRGPRRLFPGRVPGQPIAARALTTRLNRHGITARTARNGALAALAADLPAAILADLLGLHINTAVRWVNLARRDWADYLAERSRDQQPSYPVSDDSAAMDASPDIPAENHGAVRPNVRW